MWQPTDKNGKGLTVRETTSKIAKRLASYWLDFKLMLLFYFVSYVPSHTYRLFFYRLAGVRIRQRSTIHIGARFYNPSKVKIGEGSIIGDHAFLDGRDRLEIGNHVALASGVMIYNSQHDIDDPEFRAISKPVVIKDYVFVGPRAIILPGVVIEKGAVVAAGAVVTKNVREGAIVAGVPAHVVRDRNLKSFDYRLGRFKLFQ